MKYVEGTRKEMGNVGDVVEFKGIIQGLGTCKKNNAICVVNTTVFNKNTGKTTRHDHIWVQVTKQFQNIINKNQIGKVLFMEGFVESYTKKDKKSGERVEQLGIEGKIIKDIIKIHK